MRFIVLCLFLTFILHAEIKCPKSVDAKLFNYVIKREYIIKNNKCVSRIDKSILKNSNSDWSIELDGTVSAIENILIDNILLVKINSGKKGHELIFFSINDVFGTLKPIKGGEINSYFCEPTVTIDYYHEKITVVTREYYQENEKLYINSYEYIYDKKQKVFKKKELKHKEMELAK